MHTRKMKKLNCKGETRNNVDESSQEEIKKNENKRQTNFELDTDLRKELASRKYAPKWMWCRSSQFRLEYTIQH